jgi:capsular exopolysaccharide synthesis family protein
MQDERFSTILWRGKYLILGTVVAAVLISLLATSCAAEEYEATAILEVSSIDTSGPDATDLFTAQQASQALARTYARLIVDQSFLEQIRSQVANGELSATELQDRLSAEAVEETALIELRAEGDSPEEARQLADEVATAFIGTIREESAARSARLIEQIRTEIASINEEIQRVSAGAAGGGDAAAEELAALRATRAALTAQLAGVAANGVEQGTSVSLVAPPTASSDAVRPRPLLNLLAGALIGLLAGIGLAWLRARLDRGLHSSDEAEELLGTPILASIPIRKPYVADEPALREAHDVLRTNLAFLALDQPLQVVMFASYSGREGVTSTVYGLAQASVRGGMHVLLVDGDLRKRALSLQAGLEGARGLSNVVAGMGRESASDLVVELEPGLALLPAGPPPPNPPSLLATSRIREAIGELRQQFGLILIDSPPVAHLADGTILAALADGVVIVGRVGLTNRSDLAGAAANLRHSPTPVVGVVVLEPRATNQAYGARAKRRAPASESGVPS